MNVVIDRRPLWVIFMVRSFRYFIFMLLALATYYVTTLSPPEGLSQEGLRAMAVFGLALILWVTHMLPLAITGLLAMVLISLMGIMSSQEVYSLFGNEAIFFILGDLILASGVLKTGLSSRLALIVLTIFGSDSKRLVLGIFLTSSFMSFWMPEHAVAAMMFPIVLEIVRGLELKPMESDYAKALFISLAWGAIIGGVATFLGGARNPLVLLAKKMGKQRIIAETGAGQHGVATATACALLGLDCEIYMGSEDIARQKLNVFRMRLLGSKVNPVESGSRTLKDAINEAMRDWVTNVGTTHYVLGTVHGPHPYPVICRDFQSVIGREAKQQIMEQEGRMPDVLIACVGGGSNAIGLMYEFIEDDNIRMIGVEAGGTAIEPGKHAARFAGGTPGMLQGAMSYVLQDPHGQILGTHSVSAGLDYASVGPEHAFFQSIKRIEYTYAMDQEALDAFQLCSRLEGIIPALESAHAIAEAVKLVPTLPKDNIVIVNLSGRGDKDVAQAAQFILPDEDFS